MCAQLTIFFISVPRKMRSFDTSNQKSHIKKTKRRENYRVPTQPLKYSHYADKRYFCPREEEIALNTID